MSNEELAALIKNGDDGLLPTLWEQVRRFVAMMAGRYYRSIDNPHGCELDDLIQEGYIGVVNAVKYYDPKKGYLFLTFLNQTLKTAFRTTMGTRTSKRDQLDYADSLDAPIAGTEDLTLLESLSDLKPGEAAAEDTIVESIWNQELHAALDEALGILSRKKRELLELYYYFGLNFTKIAEMRGCSPQLVNDQHQESLNRIYNSKYRPVLAEFLYHYEPDPYAHLQLRLHRGHPQPLRI